VVAKFATTVVMKSADKGAKMIVVTVDDYARREEKFENASYWEIRSGFLMIFAANCELLGTFESWKYVRKV
jgi:hypothetical protein